MDARQYIIIGRYHDVMCYAPEFKSKYNGIVLDPGPVFTNARHHQFIEDAIKKGKSVISVTPLNVIVDRAATSIISHNQNRDSLPGIGGAASELLWLNDHNYRFHPLEETDLINVMPLLHDKHKSLAMNGHLFIAHPPSVEYRRRPANVFVDPNYDKYLGSEREKKPNYNNVYAKLTILWGIQEEIRLRVSVKFLTNKYNSIFVKAPLLNDNPVTQEKLNHRMKKK